MKEYRDISGYEGLYSVSSDGEVLSLRRGKHLSQCCETKGYMSVMLCNNGVSKRVLVHRLVYSEFVGDISGQIDHKDGNRKNNKLENLRDVTRAQDQWNTVVQKNKTCSVKGVYRAGASWYSEFRCNGERIRSKCFRQEAQAIRWYEIEIVRHRGRQACPRITGSC